MNKLILIIILFAIPIFGSITYKPKVYKYSIEIDGRRYPTDSIWHDKKHTYWIGHDGFYYGMKTKVLEKRR